MWRYRYILKRPHDNVSVDSVVAFSYTNLTKTIAVPVVSIYKKGTALSLVRNFNKNSTNLWILVYFLLQIREADVNL